VGTGEKRKRRFRRPLSAGSGGRVRVDCLRWGVRRWKG
jgi:hypothetical protein